MLQVEAATQLLLKDLLMNPNRLFTWERLAEMYTSGVR